MFWAGIDSVKGRIHLCKIDHLVFDSNWSCRLAMHLLIDLPVSGLFALMDSDVDDLRVSYNKVPCAVCNYEQARSRF